MSEDLLLTDEEIRKGCSAYIDHGGIGAYCRLKPYIRHGGKIYCKRHNPIRLKAESDERSREFLANLEQAQEQRRTLEENIKKQERERADKILRQMVANLKRARWQDDWGVRGVIYDSFISPIVEKARQALKGATDG